MAGIVVIGLGLTVKADAVGGQADVFRTLRLDRGDNAAPLPEPATLLLLGGGLIGVASLARRRKA